MGLSRRQFFKGLGGILVASGIYRFKNTNYAMAKESKTARDGKIGITWLGHGSFLFTSLEGKRFYLIHGSEQTLIAL